MSDECPFGAVRRNPDFATTSRPTRPTTAGAGRSGCRRRKSRSLSAVIPRRYRDVSFDPPAGERDRASPDRSPDAVRSFSNRIDDHLDAGRGLWFMGPPRHREDHPGDAGLKSGAEGRPLGGDLLAAPPAERDPGLVSRAHRPPAACCDRLIAIDLLHIDDVGAERTHRLGARRAVLDRQRPLRG